ncbi:tRNA (adenosine(37)-N6)-threonylcarbamoyltransferase complex ATPase subunit type 1 TsaE [Synoicihabitans lomoniglobus]|uniref:tRNA threonylcarbamoyladenosine biosynthesis protein TsaE n=1 Tax=Synoicihabitans lomoniglobus TaxID=2909285 RepID=A0AAF0I3E8_9BACT|nr:tRNA (adenosine(37)-N6)-threonylcarbamoyltransferase complex ATPase subunit type 1 TsaE [Opitutaceae bacterium LMO-M01]WED66089.1 tRNA (adenosine(37)-N6)-threonylcarbamoyltransferase complex ATPase subunit type 1 TsaE [Opitutaceae bacterium LMO-M01]
MASNICDKLRAGVATGSAAATRALATELAAALPDDTVLALHGDLGVGKTTFVQGLAAGLGIHDPVTSPTFNLYTLYPGPRRLLHLDAYRLENGGQVDALMLEDFLISPWIAAIEWPERIADWMPPDAWHLELGITADEQHTLRLR